jgi:hypothetical protein
LKVVVQRVFVALADSKLDTFIFPKTLECVHAVQWHGVFGADLGVGGDDLCESLRGCQYPLTGSIRLRLAYNVGFVRKVHLLLLHGAKDDLERVQKVVEDGDLPLLSLRG